MGQPLLNQVYEGIFYVNDSDWGWSENTGSHIHTKITHKKDKV